MKSLLTVTLSGEGAKKKIVWYGSQQTQNFGGISAQTNFMRNTQYLKKKTRQKIQNQKKKPQPTYLMKEVCGPFPVQGYKESSERHKPCFCNTK